MQEVSANRIAKTFGLWSTNSAMAPHVVAYPKPPLAYMQCEHDALMPCQKENAMHRPLSVCAVLGSQPALRVHSIVHKRQSTVCHRRRSRVNSERQWPPARVVTSTFLQDRGSYI